MTPQELTKILSQHELSRDNLVEILNMNNSESQKFLYDFADRERIEYCGEDVHVRGVIELSNHCEQNCLYCSQREDNFSLQRYRMSPDEVFDAAEQVVKSGIYTIVLQAGEDSELDVDKLAYLIYSLKNSFDVAITLSLGERQLDEYQRWKIAGADRYILKHETCNESNYSYYRNKKFLEGRIQHLKYLKRLGYQIGSGNIIGLPKQTTKDIADDILLMKELNVDIVDIMTFQPYPFTPLQNFPRGSMDLTLKTISLSRIVLKNVHIHALIPMKNGDLKSQLDGLTCGANAVLTDFTPEKYRLKNQMHPGELYTRSLKSSIESVGRNISFSKGDSLKIRRSISP